MSLRRYAKRTSFSRQWSIPVKQLSHICRIQISFSTSLATGISISSSRLKYPLRNLVECVLSLTAYFKATRFVIAKIHVDIFDSPLKFFRLLVISSQTSWAASLATSSFCIIFLQTEETSRPNSAAMVSRIYSPGTLSLFVIGFVCDNFLSIILHIMGRMSSGPRRGQSVSIRFVLPRWFRGRTESAAHSPHSRRREATARTRA